MGSCGSCVFKVGYKAYANTRLGKYMHASFISHFQNKYGEDAMHSRMTQFVFGNLVIIPIPVLTSNYTYVVADVENLNFVLIDVGHDTKFITPGMQPDAILTTHKHWDHCYGNQLMRDMFKGVPIYGGERDHVPGATATVSDGEVIQFGRLRFTAVWTPGHTKGHMCYLLDGKEFDCPSSLFTGDHVMLGGCGANFECSIKVMIASLDKILLYPEDTMIWPGHEVGLSNLMMAVFLEKSNVVALQKLLWIASRRTHKLCTCPSNVGEERLYNPFLRTHDPTLLSHLGLISGVDRTTRTGGASSKLQDWLKRDNDDIRVMCFKEILKRLSDTSEESKKRKADLVDVVIGSRSMSEQSDA